MVNIATKCLDFGLQVPNKCIPLYQEVLVIDDVRTTGTTVVRYAQALMDAGAGDVSVLTFAQARKNAGSTKKYR